MPTTSNFGWTTPADTDLVKDGALAIRTLGNGIDTSMAQLKGGTTGQVLSKTSNTDMAFTWVTQDDANAIQNAIVDAKGDLIAATANDTPARLAVGNNGETLVADSSTSTGLRYNPQNALANPVINGGMDIWQRGTSVANSGGLNVWTADRWKTYTNAPAITVSRQATGDTTNLPNLQYCARVQRNSGQTSTGLYYFASSFETTNAIPFAGKAVTFSFYARAGANYSTTSSALTANLYSGTGTDQNWIDVAYTGQATVAGGTATLTTTWQRFVFTGTVATTATELAIVFQTSGTGTAGANDWFEVTGVQIDLGTYTASSAPTFRRSGGTLAGERSACERYYVRFSGGTVPMVATSGFNVGTTSAVAFTSAPVTMRVVPTSVEFSNLVVVEMVSNVSFAVTNLAVSSVTNGNQLALDVTSSGLTAGRVIYMRGNASGSPYLGFSAEL